MTLRHVSLCTGYGGLDIAGEALLGGELAWCAEWEDAPSVVIEARYPGVPNVRDVRAIPWWIMAPADVVTAGYPCQPFSLAGGRLGEDDPRHLWPSIAEGIGIMRPRHVLLENVRGHLSLGFDTVLHDLHRLGYAVVWRILSAAAVGACHRRERLFIYAQPLEHVAQPVGPVLAVAGEDGWLAAEEDLFGERAPWVAKDSMPVSGVMREGRIYSVPMEQPPITGPLFPTPLTSDSKGAAPADASRDSEQLRSVVVRMLPTPTTQDAAASGGSNESNVTLTDAVVRTEMGTRPNPRLLPTPSAADGGNGGRLNSPGHQQTLPGTVRDLADALLPTPQASDAAFSSTARTGGRPLEKSTKLGTQMALLQTPTAALAGGVQTLERQVGGRWAFEDRAGNCWGKYAAAVERHAVLVGRPAPAPTQPNTKGNPELAPAFVEWMMCLEPGRVTDPALWTHLSPRKAREVQLRMLGNGVVPPQALAAYRQLGAVAAGRREAVAA